MQKNINRENVEFKSSHDKLKYEAPVHKMKKMMEVRVHNPLKGGVQEFGFTLGRPLQNPDLHIVVEFEAERFRDIF